MSNDDFRKLVGDMRKAQIAHNRADIGSPDRARWLEEAKRFEKVVDEALKDTKQQGLFDVK